MYTGIVQAQAKLAAVDQHPTHHTFALALADRERSGLELGASVAVNGVCLTVSTIEPEVVRFDVVPETLQRTNLGEVKAGELVNVERSARIGDENGGHEVSGHIDGRAEIVAIDQSEGRYAPRFRVPLAYSVYLFDKGFIALDGASLTVCDVDRKNGEFSINLIPETLERTRFGRIGIGDVVNFEVERKTQVIVDSVRTLLREQPELLRID